MSLHQEEWIPTPCSLKPGLAFGGIVENILKKSLKFNNFTKTFEVLAPQFQDNREGGRDEERMKLAMLESMKGVGSSSPNPAVGCYVFKENKFLFGSHTQPYGGFHAERNALAAQGLSTFPEESEVYVTLEPCSHYGKTPPCADLFLESKNIRVVVASEDPNPLVGGQGIQKIRDSGIQVQVGCLRKEVRATLLPFLKWVAQKEPFIGLKWAQSIDGKLADLQGSSKWLTGEALKNYTFWLRQKYDCIAVGLGTLLADRPALNVRAFEDELVIRNPLRIVLDPRGKFLAIDRAEQMRLLGFPSTENAVPWVVVSGKANAGSPMSFESNLDCKTLGEHLLVSLDQNRFLGLFREFLRSHELQKRNGGRQVQSLLVEGGATIHSMFLSNHAFDILHVYQAPLLLGGAVHTVSKESDASTFPHRLTAAPRLHLLQSFAAGCDTVTEYVTDETAQLLSAIQI